MNIKNIILLICCTLSLTICFLCYYYKYKYFRLKKEKEILIKELKDKLALSNAFVNIYIEETKKDPEAFIEKSMKLKKEILDKGDFVIEIVD